MKRMLVVLKVGLVVMFVVGMVAISAIALYSWSKERSDNKESSPLATPTAPATVDVSLKIEPELLALAELEEQQPGQAREQAAGDIFFDEQDRVEVIVELDPDMIVVQPSETVGKPLGEQEAARLIIAYGAQILSEMSTFNMIGAYVPLDQIEALAQEEAVTYIWLSRLRLLDDPSTPTAVARAIPTKEIHPLPLDIRRIYPEPGSIVSSAEFGQASSTFVEAPPRSSICVSITFFELVEPGDFLTAEEWLRRMYLIVDGEVVTQPFATHLAYNPPADLVDPETGKVVGQLPEGRPVNVCYDVQLAAGQHTATFVAEKTSDEEMKHTWSFVLIK